MPLAALIAAQENLESGEGLRATLPVAGRTVIEYQVGAVVAAGVTRVVLLVERIPAALAQAIDRLRRDGVTIEAARSVSDAADRFHPDDDVLLVADGCVVGQSAIDRLVQTPAPALLALPDTAEQAMFERIDPDTRWAGYALITGISLHDTNRMLGDWDLTSTQLRRSVQQGAARVDALAPAPGEAVGRQPILAIGRRALVTLERDLLHRPPVTGGDWVDRYLHRLIGAPLVGPLIARHIQPLHIALGSAGLAWIGALAAVFGSYWAAVILLPVATAAFAVARQMARIWSADVPEARWIILARQAAALLALAMLAYHLDRQGGWGWWGVAAIVPLGLTGLSALRPIARTIGVTDLPSSLPRSDALIWIAPVLAILIGWAWMTVLLAAYCGFGFGWLLHRVRQGAMHKGRE